MATETDRLDWNSEFANEGKEFTVLPKNTVVEFTVTDFQRTKTQKGDYMAKLALKCETAEGLSATLRENLVLLRSCEWKICQFFTCVGLRKHGDRGTLKWDSVLGSRGKAKLGVEKWQGRDGKFYDGNVIKEYLEPEESSPSTTASASDNDDEDLF